MRLLQFMTQSGQSQSLSSRAVVVGHRPAPTRLQRQPGLGAVERLDLALFVQPQHDRVRRRFHIEADDVGELGFVGPAMVLT
jgi:hypothetical protein